MSTVPTARAALRACAGPLIAYAATLAAAVLMAAVVVGGIAAGGEGSDDPTSGIDIEAIGTLIGLPFQLTGMALGGALGISDSGFSISLFAPPLFLTAVFAVVVLVLARRAERAAPSASTLERALLSASGGAAVAVVTMIATRVLAMRADGTTTHAATTTLALGAFTLATGAGWLGRQAVVGSLWPRALPHDARRAVHLVAQHLLAWLVVGVPLATVWFMLDGGLEAGLFSLVFGPTVALASLSLGHLGAVSLAGQQQFAWDLGWFPGVALPLTAVLLTLLAAVAWHLRRRHDTVLLAQAGSWVWLPIASAVGALVVCVVSTVRISGAFEGVGGGTTLHNAYWLVPVMAVWGGLTEALSRSVAPALVGAVPAPLARRLAQGPRALEPAPAAPVTRVPMSPADRARARRALIGVGVVGGLGLAAVVTVNVVGSTVYTPEKAAEAYLDALVDGDVATALELAPIEDREDLFGGDDAPSTALLTDEVYRAAADRITGYEITDVEEFGGSVEVSVDLEGVESEGDVTLTLSSSGSRAVLFDDWKVDDAGLLTSVSVPLPEGATGLTANGTAIEVDDTSGTGVDLWALPGTYRFDPYGGSRWLAPAETDTVVPAGSYGAYADLPQPEASQELKDAVTAEIDALLERCMAATEVDPADCPQDAFVSGDRQRDVSWRLDVTPTVSWDAFYGTFPAELYSDVPGEATITYEYDASYGFGRPDWQREQDSTTFYLSVSVDLVDDEPVVTFDSY
ncbi:hypothetical protein [Nocardioides sp.]|uniref:hypothetical protein n=1 Tax=Nocardioides sp. TaxID=35761 RepID=UPI0035197E8C